MPVCLLRISVLYETQFRAFMFASAHLNGSGPHGKRSNNITRSTAYSYIVVHCNGMSWRHVNKGTKVVKKRKKRVKD
jgi:hypothetical protein